MSTSETERSLFYRTQEQAVDYLKTFHKKYEHVFQGGSIYAEYVEQLMACMIIRPEDRVLELGSNVGRTTVTIASLLNDSSQLDTLEPGHEYYLTLLKNKDIGSWNFKTHNVALSLHPMVRQGYDCFTWPNSDFDPPAGYEKVNTVHWDTFKETAVTPWNVLMVDIEGALSQILDQFPRFLDSFSTIIIENDFKTQYAKQQVHAKFTSEGFHDILTLPLTIYPDTCNADDFYQIWVRDV
uniref:Methyltransferase FkbM domain-containing protein n=1 Tax=viral metagenome TaxID=1070528 RepID=A0A6C0CSK0_9ZZZZ